MATILVTGGAGFIGSHTAKALSRAGHHPITLDNLVHGHEDAVRWGPLVVGDIGDTAALAAVFAEHRPAAVIHFAAFAYVGQSVTDPAIYYRNNVAGMLTLLEVMRDHDCPALVFSSSCATYGVPDALPIVEASRQQPINPYGTTKLIGEKMLADFAAAYGLTGIALRYFNAAGADPEGELGERHHPETHLIPLALDAAAGGTPLMVFGNDYPTPDGTCLRDYIHVADLADAHVAAVERLLAGTPLPAALNLGTGRGYSIREIIDAVGRITGRPVPHGIAPRRPGDPAELVADATAARRALDWSPRRSGIDEIVATAWAARRRFPVPA